MHAMADRKVGAACGFVIPRYVNTIWERGRYAEYLITLGFFKAVQDHYHRPLISSGCFSVYRTDILKAVGGWSTRTLAEDMDLTWTLYRRGDQVRFVKDAVSYPIEPHDFGFLSKQLRRWSHGFVQNVRLHWRHVIADRFLSLLVTVAMFDSIMAPLMYLFALPLLALAVSPWYLIAYVFDLPIVAVPIIVEGAARGEFLRALASLPAFLVLRQINAVFMLGAVWSELVLGRSFHIFEKGH
jgi:biofilm PGA synthesis N-glycosyltransferase PgaC